MGCQFSKSQKVTQPTLIKSIKSRGNKSQIIDSRKNSVQTIDQILQNVKITNQILTEQKIIFVSNILKEHDFFSSLNDDQLKLIIKKFITVQGKKGEYLFNRGDIGNNFFFILEGRVDVQIDKKFIRTLYQGKTFGQHALIFKAPRSASIICKGEKNIFLLLKPNLFRQTLKIMNTKEAEKNRSMIQSSSIFNGLSNKEKQLLSQYLKKIKLKKNQIIFKKEDIALNFYIISSGEVRIQIQNKQPLILGVNESFGENAFKANSYRAGTAIANSQTICYYLQKIDLQNLFSKKFDNIFHYNLKKWALMRSQNFKIDNDLIDYVISKFQLFYANQNQILVSSVPTGLIISLQGIINQKPHGTLFCQESYKNRSKIVQPIVQKQAGFYAYIDFECLDKIMNEINLFKFQNKNSQKKMQLQKENVFCNLKIFKFIKQLGQGQFGKVYLIKNNENNCLYALKCLSKEQIKKQGMQKAVIQEKNILSKIIFPYIVGYVQSFHDEKNIYLLMQYIKGKQMFDVIRQLPYLNKKIAQYYFGCILLAIQYLHKKNIIYRDIKPENSVIDLTGKAFLIDLGTAKVLTQESSFKTFTLIGTPHYMAPQIMDGKGYSFQIDIWALGILLYQFVYGFLPFAQNQTDPYYVMNKIKKDPVKYPKHCNLTPDTQQLLQMLLQKNPKVRIIKASIQAIKSSKYFSDIQWKSFFDETFKIPYVPKDFKNKKNTMNKLQGKHLGQYLFGKQIHQNGWNVKQWNQQFEFCKNKTSKTQKIKINSPFKEINVNT